MAKTGFENNKILTGTEKDDPTYGSDIFTDSSLENFNFYEMNSWTAEDPFGADEADGWTVTEWGGDH